MDHGRKAGRLREFSTQLAARLQAAPRMPAEPARLALRIGAGGYLVDMAEAGEIVALPEITPVPWTRPWFHGLANVRGRLLGVVDLLQLAGEPPLPPGEARQLLVLGDDLKYNAGLLVTRAFGLRNLKDLVPAPPAAVAGRPWESRRYIDRDGTTLVELDLRRLTQLEEFAAIGV